MKAVIPAAGFGTRFLPFTKSVPKELIPIVDKPVIQYVVEEAIESGIDDILIIISSGKESICQHFNPQFELEQRLESSGKTQLLADQRTAGYIRLYYGDRPDPVTQKLNDEVYALLNAKRYHETVKVVQADAALMERVQSDAEAANAYGIALYFTALDNKDTDAEEQAIDLIKRAARQGSDAAIENLKGIETYGPARKEYDAWVAESKKQ